MNHKHYDVVVIGGGPAGSTLSTFLARKGYSVLVIEREKFPRFHVGESLLPGTQLIWEKLGIAEPMQHLGHTFKYGAEFRLGLDPRQSDYDYTLTHFNNFPRNKIQERPFAYQVDRSDFDMFLLNHARKEGVTVFEEAVVKEVLWQDDKTTGIRWRTKDGFEYVTEADCIADCSGRHAFIARNRQFLVPDQTIKTSAVFAHFKHVTRAPGAQQGYFTGYFIENGWMWFIPLHSDVMSVGLVMNQPGTDEWSKKSPEDILLSYINRYKFIRDRFEQAEQSSKVRMLCGLPYKSTRSTGDGWILVGDANFFVDPLYSSGVHIAFHSAEKAANAIDGFLQNNRNMNSFQHYEKWSRRYQFHVFTTMGIVYKMLKYQISIGSYVKLTGKYSNHWDNPLLRRLTAWGTGYFDQLHWALYCSWAVSALLIGIGQAREKFLNRPGWDTHAEFCSEPPLTIPKSIESGNGKVYKPAPAATPVRDVNYSEHWVVPMDLSDNVQEVAL